MEMEATMIPIRPDDQESNKALIFRPIENPSQGENDREPALSEGCDRVRENIGQVFSVAASSARL